VTIVGSKSTIILSIASFNSIYSTIMWTECVMEMLPSIYILTCVEWFSNLVVILLKEIVAMSTFPWIICFRVVGSSDRKLTVSVSVSAEISGFVVCFGRNFRFRYVLRQNFRSGKYINFDLLCPSVSVSVSVQNKPTFRYFCFCFKFSFRSITSRESFLSCAWTSCNRCYVE
jgi:hypothetical protein